MTTLTATPTRLRHSALITMALTSFTLVTAEFLPNGMLTDIAFDLGVSVGQAGQMTTVTAFVGFFAALLAGVAFPRIDRRTLLAGLALAAAVSNLAVAVAPSLGLMLASRALLGATISGFWSMSLVVAAKIAGPERLGRAVMFTTSGLSLATILGVPLGVALSTVAGWRTVFGVMAALCVAVGVGLLALLPRVPAAGAAPLAQLWQTLRRGDIALGLAGHVLTVFGHFVAYAYIRPALERVSSQPAILMLLLSLFGVGGFLGNLVAGAIADRWLSQLALAIPAVIAVSILLVIGAHPQVFAVGIAMTLWGAAFAGWLIVINTWTGRRAPLEAGGSLVTAGFQLAITAAAVTGGLLVDSLGVVWAYLTGVVVIVIGTVVFTVAERRPATATAPRLSPAGTHD
ncbi:MAG: MFS transporter [Microbacterium sp.]